MLGGYDVGDPDILMINMLLVFNCLMTSISRWTRCSCSYWWIWSPLVITLLYAWGKLHTNVGHIPIANAWGDLPILLGNRSQKFLECMQGIPPKESWLCLYILMKTHENRELPKIIAFHLFFSNFVQNLHILKAKCIGGSPRCSDIWLWWCTSWCSKPLGETVCWPYVTLRIMWSLNMST